jgi:hypothetical protein
MNTRDKRAKKRQKTGAAPGKTKRKLRREADRRTAAGGGR